MRTRLGQVSGRASLSGGFRACRGRSGRAVEGRRHTDEVSQHTPAQNVEAQLDEAAAERGLHHHPARSRGARPGVRYVRVICSTELPVRQIGQRHLVAGETLPRTRFGRAMRRLRRALDGHPLATRLIDYILTVAVSVSAGVAAFQLLESEDARSTLRWMGTMFLGIAYFAHHGTPVVSQHETLVSQQVRTLPGSLLAHIDHRKIENRDQLLNIVLPEFVPAHAGEQLILNQVALRLKAALLFRPGVVPSDVPHHLAG